jgi:hypothetical protein
MSRVAALAQKDADTQDWVTFHQAFVPAYAGRIQKAVRMSSHPEDLAQETGHGERSTMFATAPIVFLLRFQTRESGLLLAGGNSAPQFCRSIRGQ